MKNKPHIWGKRFFNHKYDSAVTHVKSIWNTVLNMSKHKLWRTKKHRSLFDPETINKNWVVSADIKARSIEPRVTWIGHATFLIQIGGINILTDPAFFEISHFIPRIVQAPISIEKLPKIDVLLVSHNHIDHLDSASVKLLKKQGHKPIILTPEGTKTWFDYYGFDNAQEKSWWDEHKEKGITFSFLPAAHWSGRNLFDTNKTLWGSWMIACNGFKIYFAGDSTYANHFSQIGKAHPDIDVAIMPIAPNGPAECNKNAHITTPESVKAFCDLKARNFIPMHWGTFSLEADFFDAPIKLLLKLWGKHHDKLKVKTLNVLKFGESRTFIP